MKNLTQIDNKTSNELYDQLKAYLDEADVTIDHFKLNEHIRKYLKDVQMIKKADSKIYFFLEKKLYQLDLSKNVLRRVISPAVVGENYFGYLLINLISKSIVVMPADLSKSDIDFNLTARIRLLNEINETIVENRLYDAFGLQYQESANLINYLFMFVDSEPGFIDLTFNGSAQFHIRVQKHNEITFTIDSISQVIL